MLRTRWRLTRFNGYLLNFQMDKYGKIFAYKQLIKSVTWWCVWKLVKFSQEQKFPISMLNLLWKCQVTSHNKVTYDRKSSPWTCYNYCMVDVLLSASVVNTMFVLKELSSRSKAVILYFLIISKTDKILASQVYCYSFIRRPDWKRITISLLVDQKFWLFSEKWQRDRNR